MSDTLFELPKAEHRRISVVPASVVEVGEQHSDLRENGGHDRNSSRSQYSPFPCEVSSLCFELYLRECSTLFDPFAGWGDRHAAAQHYGRKYTGFDINPVAIDAARERYGVENQLADSERDPIPNFDGLITCPPYWCLEKYSPNGIDAAKTWGDFLGRYCTILARCFGRAEPGARFCIVTGDWRDGGEYFPLTHETRAAMYCLGAKAVDEVVISRAKVSKIKVMIPQAVRMGYTVKVHETLTVWEKESLRQ